MPAAKTKEDTVETAPEPVARGLFSYSREIRVGASGGKQSAFMSVSFPVTVDDDAESILAKAKDAAFEAKSSVFQQLQLDFTVDEGVAVELVKDAFDGTTGSYDQPAGVPQNAAAPSPSRPPYPADTQVKHEKEANEAWGQQRFAQFPGEFWDNRATKRNPRAPDLKHKDTGMPVWKA